MVNESLVRPLLRHFMEPRRLTRIDILMLSASTTFGAVVGLIRHVDFTLNWRTIQIQRFENERHHSYSDSDMFGKADVGWRLVLSWTCMPFEPSSPSTRLD